MMITLSERQLRQYINKRVRQIVEQMSGGGDEDWENLRDQHMSDPDYPGMSQPDEPAAAADREGRTQRSQIGGPDYRKATGKPSLGGKAEIGSDAYKKHTGKALSRPGSDKATPMDSPEYRQQSGYTDAAGYDMAGMDQALDDIPANVGMATDPDQMSSTDPISDPSDPSRRPEGFPMRKTAYGRVPDLSSLGSFGKAFAHAKNVMKVRHFFYDRPGDNKKYTVFATGRRKSAGGATPRFTGALTRRQQVHRKFE